MDVAGPASVPAPPTAERPSLRARLLLCLFATVLGLLLMEGGLRIFWKRPPEFMATNLRGSGLFVPDPKVGWRMTRNFRLDFRWYWGEAATVIWMVELQALSYIW